VTTGEDTEVKAAQFRGSDETLAGSFHKEHVRIPSIGPRNPDGEARIQKEMRGPPAKFQVLWLQNSGSPSYWA
jgi:hypothetical protein